MEKPALPRPVGRIKLRKGSGSPDRASRSDNPRPPSQDYATGGGRCMRRWRRPPNCYWTRGEPVGWVSLGRAASSGVRLNVESGPGNKDQVPLRSFIGGRAIATVPATRYFLSLGVLTFCQGSDAGFPGVSRFIVA